jgi:hypothetical protein
MVDMSDYAKITDVFHSRQFLEILELQKYELLSELVVVRYLSDDPMIQF